MGFKRVLAVYGPSVGIVLITIHLFMGWVFFVLDAIPTLPVLNKEEAKRIAELKLPWSEGGFLERFDRFEVKFEMCLISSTFLLMIITMFSNPGYLPRSVPFKDFEFSSSFMTQTRIGGSSKSTTPIDPQADPLLTFRMVAYKEEVYWIQS